MGCLLAPLAFLGALVILMKTFFSVPGTNYIWIPWTKGSDPEEKEEENK